MDDLWTMQVGINADLHLGAVLQEARTYLSRGREPINMEEILQICREELQVPVEWLVDPTEIAPRVMAVMSAYIWRRFPKVDKTFCLAVGQAIGELAGGDTAFGPPVGAEAQRVYQQVYNILEKEGGTAPTPEATCAFLAQLWRAGWAS